MQDIKRIPHIHMKLAWSNTGVAIAILNLVNSSASLLASGIFLLYLFIYYLGGGGETTPDDAQWLLLDLCSEIIPGDLKGPYGMLKNTLSVVLTFMP